MNDTPYISVTITSYNYAGYIVRLLESIKSQTFRDYEIVIADDASTDNSVEVIRTYMEANPQETIRLFVNEENRGIADTRNRVLEEARGTYVMFCDSDDWMEKNCLEVLAAASEQGTYDRVVSEVRDVDQNGKTLQIQHLPENPSKWMCGLHHGTIYKRRIFVEHDLRFADVGGADDFYITAMFHSCCGEAAFVRKSVYNWFIHTDSTSGSASNTDVEKGVAGFHILLETLRGMYQGLPSEDRQLFGYQLLKMYCVAIYHNGRFMKIREKWRLHRDLRRELLQFDREYDKNRYIVLGKKAPARTYARVILWCTLKAEKLHLMPLVLTLYHVAGKMHYFNI